MKLANEEAPRRQGEIATEPTLFSDVRTCKDAKQVRAILGDKAYDALFSEGANRLISNEAVRVAAGRVVFHPVLFFNTQAFPVFRLYDQLEASADGPEPVYWQKKLDTEEGQLYERASRVCGWK